MHKLFSLLATATILTSGCTTAYITPMAVTEPQRADFTRDESAPSNQKSFFLPHDWQYNNWVIKKGSKVTFYDNGFGEFSGRIFSQFTTSPDTVHFQSIQYGADGNRLFSFPDRSVGYPLHIRLSYQDYPYDEKFAYDKRFFNDIHDAKFFARTRLKSENVGDPENRLTHSSGITVIDRP
jgi:hypothetical protein